VQVKILKQLAKTGLKRLKLRLPEKLIAARKRHYSMALATAVADGASDLDNVIDTGATKCTCPFLRLVVYDDV
jgi:hypothetical protein